MLQKFKNVLKIILPPPVRAFNREIERVLSSISEDRKATHREYEKLEAALEELSKENRRNAQMLEQLVQQAAEITQLQTKISALEQSIMAGQEEVSRSAREITAAVCSEGEKVEKSVEYVKNRHGSLIDMVEAAYLQTVDGNRNAAEAVWAEIFNNAISGSTWLKNTAFSPGRWAVGYPVLYAMYRILNEARPKRILELGLGQSTRMIAQYAAAHENVEHIVVEHDHEWIDFFKNDFQLSSRSRIMQLDREMVPYKEAEAVRVFKGFREQFQGQKFDFIFIDAPLGGDMKQYARIDVLGMLPECLDDNFVIIIDDAERSGEAHTVKEMELCLKNAGIPYRRGRYCGKKDSVLLCAEHMAFLATL